jgi:hypothetical protein
MFFGLVLLAIGVIWLLEKLGVLTGSIWGYVWPTVLIIIGLSFIFNRWIWHRRMRRWFWWEPPDNRNPPARQ